MKALNNTSKYVFESDINSLRKIESFLADFFENQCISKKDYNRILLCLKEAALNSIMHGNKYIQHKKVIIEIIYSNNWLRLIIIDEGDGFDYENLPNPLAEENILKEKGRGIFLIKNLSDEVLFRNKGSEIEIKIYLGEQD